MTRRKKKNLTDALAVLLVDHGVRLVQTADSLTGEAHDRIGELAATLAALILATNFSRKMDVNAMIAQARADIVAAYQGIAQASGASIEALASVEAQALATIANGQIGAPVVRVPRLAVTPAVQGRPLADWWEAQATDTAAKVATFLRTFSQPDVNPQALADELTSAAGPLTAAARNAESLTHTAVQRVAMDSRLATLKANARVVEGMQIVATLDTRTCAQCLAYDGSTYDLEGAPTGQTVLPFNGGPEFHFHCRCMTVPIFSKFANVPESDGKPASKLTAEDWLDAKTPAEQDDILGKGRAALYRKGSLTLRDLVSGTGQQLSLAQLREKYNTKP